MKASLKEVKNAIIKDKTSQEKLNVATLNVTNVVKFGWCPLGESLQKKVQTSSVTLCHS